MLPVFATIWGMMALRHAFDEPSSGDWLLGFGLSFSVAAPLFMAGQTPFSDWGTAHCDVLAVPVLGLGAVGVVTTLVPVLAAKVLTGPALRIAALVVVSAAGLWLFYPLLGHCLAGPYAAVPPEIRAVIQTYITEALPVTTMLVDFPAILGRILLPPTLILAMALAAVWFMRGRLSPRQRIALVQAFFISVIGFAFACVQVRAANLMTPAIPMLAGFVVYAFTQIPRTNPLRAPVMLLLLAGLPATVESIVTYFLEPVPATTLSSGSTDEPPQRLGCRNAAAMAEIASLPQSLLFNPVNLGPAILATTGHSITAAAYHRSSDAFWNGLGAFKSEAGLQAALAKSGADFVVVCEGGLGDGAAMLVRAMKAPALPVWLKPVPGDRKLVAVFQVDKAALAAAGTAP